MENKTRLILKAAYALSTTERETLIQNLQNYGRVNLSEQRNFSEALNKSLGPLNTGNCPVCGK